MGRIVRMQRQAWCFDCVLRLYLFIWDFQHHTAIDGAGSKTVERLDFSILVIIV